MPEINIVGSGIYGPDQMTKESIEVLHRCDVVLHQVEHSIETVRFLESIKDSVFDASAGLYQDGSFDVSVYSAIADNVMEYTTRYNRVAYVVHGHPLVYVAPVRLLIERAYARRVAIKIYPAVSALDTMILQLGLDIGYRGLQVFDCNRFVYYQIKPNRAVPLFLLQPGCFGTGVITRSRSNLPQRFEPLKRWLLETYEETDVCYILESRFVREIAEKRFRFQLSGLCDMASEIGYASSLFLPPAAPMEIADRQFYEGLRDVAAVDALTTTSPNLMQ